MNIVQALNKVKTDILNFITTNLQHKADVSHAHEEYALSTDVESEFERLVGGVPVSEQISMALNGSSGGNVGQSELVLEDNGAGILMDAFDGTLFLGTSPSSSIYVPDNLVSDYKANTNWSKYSSIIKPLSEYSES